MIGRRGFITGLVLAVVAGAAIGVAYSEWRWTKACVIQNVQLSKGIYIDDASGCLFRNNTIGVNIDPDDGGLDI